MRPAGPNLSRSIRFGWGTRTRSPTQKILILLTKPGPACALEHPQWTTRCTWLQGLSVPSRIIPPEREYPAGTSRRLQSAHVITAGQGAWMLLEESLFLDAVGTAQRAERP